MADPYERVFMDSIDPILIEDFDGNVVDMNKQAERTYGWAPDELIGKPIKTIVPIERHAQADELLVRCKSGDEVRNVEGLRQTKDGQIVPVLLTLSLLKDDSGKPFSIATIAKDISAQKEAEAELKRLSKVFMDSVDPILIEDLDGNVLDMNMQAERTYGWAPNELIGKPIKTIVPSERHSQADELLARCKSGDEVRNIEGLRQTKDGNIVPVLLTLSLLKDDSGKPYSIATIAKDISSLKRVESQLVEYKNHLEEKVALRTRELEETNQRLREVRAQISKYIDPNVTEKIFKGEFEAALGHQRKKLTLFFSDIKDFTQFTDASDPEDVAKLLNEYLGIMARIVRKWGGTIPQFTGDSIYAIFGAPDSKGDQEDALACVRMALEMQVEMKTLRDTWWNQGIQFPFAIRCGIHSGRANVGNYGSEGFMEYSAIGLNTNLASRLEQACQPGEIYLSHATWALVNREIPCEEVGAIEVKGFHYPIQTYRVVQNDDNFNLSKS